MALIPKFDSQLPPDGSAHALLTYWVIVILMVVLYSPVSYLISRLMHHDFLVGSIGLAAYLPIYCFLHLKLHEKGVVRLSYTAGLFVLASIIFCLVFYFDPLRGAPIR
ncbi:MAG TPA: hypothetical protein VH105_03140 [Burkholderiales bacterium]|nr:hypothetical protein [Burkholderiales bacterium]